MFPKLRRLYVQKKIGRCGKKKVSCTVKATGFVGKSRTVKDRDYI